MNSPVIKPTIGRRVWFRPTAAFLASNPILTQFNPEQPMDAGIVYVHHDHMVNLIVTDHVGKTLAVPSVPLLAGHYVADEDTDVYCCCEWMPYQKSQAAKTEVADKGIVLEQRYREPTQREQLEYALVSGAASALAISPGNARQVVDGIKTVLDTLSPIAATPTSGPDNAHAAAVLYPAIERAMGELSKLHEGFNMEVNRAFNILRDAFWSECPAPASAVPKRRETADAEHRPKPHSLEREIQAKADKAPRVTPSDIEAEIVSEHYFTARDGRRGALADGTYVGREKPQMDDADLASLDLLTFCVLVLRNGFTVTGESACASPARPSQPRRPDTGPHQRRPASASVLPSPPPVKARVEQHQEEQWVHATPRLWQLLHPSLGPQQAHSILLASLLRSS